MDPGVVFVAPTEETAHDEGIEIPLDDDSTCNLKVLQSQFANAVGLRFRAPDTGRMRALRMDDNGKIYPPPQGWDNLTFIVVVDKKRTRDEDSSEKIENENKKASSDKIGDLIILGLSYKATENDVRDYFKSFGEVKSCEIKKDYGGNSRGFGFVSFVSDEVAKQVLTDTYHTISGRKCEVRIPKRTEPERKLFVGRLPRGTDEKDLSDYFSTYGALADVYIPKPHRGFAFITFERGDDAEIVLKQKHFLKDAPINVTLPDPPAKKQKFGEPEYGERGMKPFGGYRQESSSYYPPFQGYGGYGSQSGYQYNTPSATPNVTPMQAQDEGARGGGGGGGGGGLDISEPELEYLESIVKKVKSSRKNNAPQGNWS